MPIGRQFQIVYTLLNEKVVSAPVLAGRLEVSVRTIYRDVEALSLAGIPIYALPGKGGGIALMEGYTLNRSLLSDSEKTQLFLALKSVSAASPGEGAQLLQKLGGLMGDANVDWLSVDFARWGSQAQDNEKFETIKQSLIKRRMLSFDYASSSGEVVRRSVKPARLMYRSQAWYMLAFCAMRGDWRLFKLYRMKSVEMLPEPCGEMPPLPGDVPVDPVPQHQVHLLFAPRLAYRVYDEFEAGCVEILEDGTLSVKARMPADQWLLSYVLSFGAGVELIEPAWMRAMILEASKNVFEQYMKS